MPDVAAIHAGKLAQVEAYYGAACPAITWPVANGQSYPCLAGSAALHRELGEGGFAPEADIVIVVRAVLFNKAQPVVNQKFIYKPSGKTYLIEQIKVPQGSPFLLIAGVDPSKGV